jgi:diguanylate cyclase (GGDEF)-like protein
MKILLVEDDDMTRELLTEELSAARYVVEQAEDGELGLELASLWPYDLILLDLQIPKIDGLNVCRQLRNRGNTTPILMLTAQDAQEDIIAGLDTGADDYVTKPFEINQVLARIRALLRRGTNSGSQSPSLTWGKLSLNPATADVAYDHKIITLTPKEYSLLELFLRNPQRVFSRSTILDHLWSMDDYPTEGAVTNLVKDLRNRLKRGGVQETVIQTVYGLGYRLKNQAPQTEAAPAVDSATEPELSAAASKNLALIAARFQASIQQRVSILEDVIRALQAGGVAPSQRSLACQEAHRLAGGLGTFGYEEGSALARQMEQLLKSEDALSEAAVTQLSQALLALKQAIAVAPQQIQGRAEAIPVEAKHLIAIHVGKDLVLSLKALAATCHWTIETTSDVKSLLREASPSRADILLVGLNSDLPPDQKFADLVELHRQWPDLPIVVLSGCETLAERVQAVRHGVERYLVAPLTPEKLLDTLQELFTPPEDAESRVMVVDNDLEVCRTITELLTPWGLQVTTVQDSTQFWEVLRQTNPDLLILEQDMPKFSGVDLCQVVRKDSQYGDLPILMMTTYPDKLTVQQVFELGCDDLINKPIVSPELITRVLSRIERSRLRQQLDLIRQQQAVYWQRQEHIDPVTLMANARYFDTFLQQQWERHQQEQAPISLILCAPDQFGRYQETYGQPAADQLLKQVAQVLQATINPNIDLAARYSDEAFSIVLPNTNLDGALRVASRIQQAMVRKSQSEALKPKLKALSLSLGIGGTVPTTHQVCDDLLKTADQALKAAQTRGGNTFCLYRM